MMNLRQWFRLPWRKRRTTITVTDDIEWGSVPYLIKINEETMRVVDFKLPRTLTVERDIVNKEDYNVRD